ncbi:sulfite reductase [NADPH] flavoprotein alpha-component, partial [Staphylococcus aureus]|nr:sulfite reductase [NADPH] flavoprotein alpha-component [Staphylococcus aureus]
MELSVTNSPFNQEQSEKLNQVFATLTTEQKIWLSGYLSASVVQGGQASAPVVEQSTAVSSEPKFKKRDITVLFGSETGNAQGLAETLG